MIRLILRAGLLLLMLVIGLMTLFSLYRLLPLGQRCWLRKIWSRLLLSACGVALDIQPNAYRISKTPMLVVMNHVSWLDIFVLNSVMPATFIAKSEIRQWPLVGWLLQGADTLFIERSSVMPCGMSITASLSGSIVASMSLFFQRAPPRMGEGCCHFIPVCLRWRWYGPAR